MKILSILFFCLLFVYNSWGQFTPIVTPVIDQFGTIRSMDSKAGANANTSVYLSDQWIISDIYLKAETGWGKIEDVSLKLDLKTNTIEIHTEEGIKVLDHSKVEKFEWINPQNNRKEVYFNCDRFNLKGTKLDGFCLIYGDNPGIARHYFVETIKADYNVALDVGSKEDRIVIKSKLYLLKDNELIECSKKSIYAVMGDKADRIKQFVKKNQLRFNEEEDVRSLIDYYNSI